MLSSSNTDKSIIYGRVWSVTKFLKHENTEF